MSSPDLNTLADTLDASPDFQVLRRFALQRTYATPTGGERVRTAAAVDVETTGLSAGRDAIIELSIVPFTYDADSGRIFETGDVAEFLEDPGRPIPPEIVALTGITDDMVRGRQIDEKAVHAVLEPVTLVIAHHAKFDRPFTERRLPEFVDLAWACSLEDVPWRERGLSSAALEYLLMKRCRRFYGAHRADQDAAALVHLLATPFDDGTLPMSLLLARARAGTARIWAEGAPIELKDALKARRYQWSAGNDGRPKAWFRDVDASTKDAELEWLSQNIFGGKLPRLRIDTLDARTRYSDRPGSAK